MSKALSFKKIRNTHNSHWECLPLGSDPPSYPGMAAPPDSLMSSARVDGARRRERRSLVRMMGFSSSEQTGLKGDDTVFLPLPNKVGVHHSAALSLFPASHL